MRAAVASALSLALLAGCATQGGDVSAQEEADLASFLTPVPASRPPLATDAPLGTEENPVRAVGPAGQRDYLARLRCKDGLAPEFSRTGSVGLSGYGKMMDGYRVQCRGEAERIVVMDMYHCAQESRTVPGFQLMDSVATPMTQQGCDAP
ncbi:hypothetical protein [Arenimonas sp. MALMAid1274]|uniref:hypothetical protein n=1 Tax=Arenimonas sp. MALMAid1274 TaxID=3411630 RepID=UPI003B9EF103